MDKLSINDMPFVQCVVESEDKYEAHIFEWYFVE